MISLLFKYFSIFKEAEPASPRLHGVDLNKWHYLGHSDVSFTYIDSTHTDNAYVFFFCSRDDEDLRKYVLIADNNAKHIQDKFSHHPWVIKTAELWLAGERHLYEPINNEPSLYLKDKMLEEHKAVWSKEKNWWVSNEDAKYQSAKKSQAKKKPKEEPEVIPVEDNIVKIEFKREKDDA